MKMKISGPIALSVFLTAAGIGGFCPTNASALDCSSFFTTGPAVCGDLSVTGGSRSWWSDGIAQSSFDRA